MWQEKLSWSEEEKCTVWNVYESFGASDIRREDLHRSVIPDLHRPALEPWFYIDLHILTSLDYLLYKREGMKTEQRREKRKIEDE